MAWPTADNVVRTGNWELKLQQGEWFEENVARPWLLKNRPEAWITDSRNHKRQGGRGPRLAKQWQELTLPDFRLDVPETGKSSWLDSKLKFNPFVIEGQGNRRFYSLDPLAYQRYLRLMQVFHHMDFEILLGCDHTRVLWLFDLRRAAPVMHEFYNEHTRYRRSLTPCFSTDQMRMVGIWDNSDLPRYPSISAVDLPGVGRHI